MEKQLKDYKIMFIKFKTKKASGIFMLLPENVQLDMCFFNETYPQFFQYYLDGSDTYERLLKPLNEFEIINFSNNITEEQASKIVEFDKETNSYYNYRDFMKLHPWNKQSAVESFKSLLEKYELYSGKWLVLIKTNK